MAKKRCSILAHRIADPQSPSFIWRSSSAYLCSTNPLGFPNLILGFMRISSQWYCQIKRAYLYKNRRVTHWSQPANFHPSSLFAVITTLPHRNSTQDEKGAILIPCYDQKRDGKIRQYRWEKERVSGIAERVKWKVVSNQIQVCIQMDKVKRGEWQVLTSYRLSNNFRNPELSGG